MEHKCWSVALILQCCLAQGVSCALGHWIEGRGCRKMRKYITWIGQCQSPYGFFTRQMKRDTAFQLNFDKFTDAIKSGYPIFSGYYTSLLC